MTLEQRLVELEKEMGNKIDELESRLNLQQRQLIILNGRINGCLNKFQEKETDRKD